MHPAGDRFERALRQVRRRACGPGAVPSQSPPLPSTVPEGCGGNAVLSALLERQHATAEQRKFFLDADRRIRSEILETGKVPQDVPTGLASLYPNYLGRFLKSELALNPVALAANVQGPILVINGAADRRQTSGKALALRASLADAAQPDSHRFRHGSISP